LDKLILSVEEACGLIGLGRTEIFHLLKRGEIASFKVGKRRLVPVQALHDWVARQVAEQA